MQMIVKSLLLLVVLLGSVEARVGSCSLFKEGNYTPEYLACLKAEAIKTDSIEDINFYAYSSRGNIPFEETLSWYQKSVDKGDSFATNEIAELYKSRNKTVEAIAWYKKASKQEYEDAIESLSQYMQELYGDKESVAIYKRAIKAGDDVYWNKQYLLSYYARMKAYDKAVDLIDEIIVEFPKERALMLLAKAGFYSKGYLDDPKRYFEYNQKAADLGNKDAMYNLGIYYGDKGEYERASAWFIKADRSRMVCLMYGEKLHQPKKEIACYEQLVSEGDSSAMFNMGYVYYFSLKDIDNAAKWYTKAYEYGEASGALNMGNMYKKLGQREKSIYWYKKAADMGKEGAIVYLLGEGVL